MPVDYGAFRQRWITGMSAPKPQPPGDVRPVVCAICRERPGVRGMYEGGQLAHRVCVGCAVDRPVELLVPQHRVDTAGMAGGVSG